MSKLEKLPIRIRRANEEDTGFIFNAWLKSFRNSPYAKPIESQIYFNEHHRVIENLLKRYETLVVCAEDDPVHIYGFINAGYTDGIFTINYVYVKHVFRNMGVATALLNSFPQTSVALFTHQNHVSNKLAPRFNMVYHPYVALDSEKYEASSHVNIETAEDSKATEDSKELKKTEDSKELKKTEDSKELKETENVG